MRIAFSAVDRIRRVWWSMCESDLEDRNDAILNVVLWWVAGGWVASGAEETFFLRWETAPISRLTTTSSFLGRGKWKWKDLRFFSWRTLECSTRLEHDARATATKIWVKVNRFRSDLFLHPHHDIILIELIFNKYCSKDNFLHLLHCHDSIYYLFREYTRFEWLLQ